MQRQKASKPYRRIVIIGSSMGGLLGYDVVRDLRAKSLTTPIEMVVLDPPTGAADFQFPNNLKAHALRVLPFGPIWNQFNIIDKMFIPPKEENIESGVDRAELARYVEQGKSHRLSFYRDQLMYIMSHATLKAGSLVGLVDRLTIVRSTRDTDTDTVRASASAAWFAAFPDAVKIEVDSTHVGFAERPETWRQFFKLLS